MVRINVTNLIFDDIQREHSSVDGSNLEGDMHARYGVNTTATSSDELINQSTTAPQPPTVQQTTNSEDRLVVYH